jgi:hypothetical protein
MNGPGAQLRGVDTARPVLSTIGLLAVAGAVSAVLLYGADRTEDSQAFVATIEFGVWALALSATVALWVGIAVVLARSVANVFDRRDLESIAWAVGGHALIVAGLLGALLSTEAGPSNPLYEARVKVPLLVGFVLVMGFPAVLGLWWIQARLGQLSRELPLAPPIAATPPVTVGTEGGPSDAPAPSAGLGVTVRTGWVGTLLGLRRLLQRILAAASVGISAAVLSTGALRNALIASGAETEQTFPSYWVLAYGSLFTAIFALIFVPTFVEWRGNAQRLLDDAFPIPPDGKPSSDWHDGRANMAKMLELDVSPLRSLGPLTGVLAPALTSLAAVLVSELGA